MVFADMPGKAKMYASKVSFQHTAALKNYRLYWKTRTGDLMEVTGDSSFSIDPSNGAPEQGQFWGINKISRQSTDTLEFFNYYAPDYLLIIDSVIDNHIHFLKVELSNKNEIVKDKNTSLVENKALLADAKKARWNHYFKIIALSLAAAVALAGLSWLILRRKKAKVKM